MKKILFISFCLLFVSYSYWSYNYFTIMNNTLFGNILTIFNNNNFYSQIYKDYYYYINNNNNTDINNQINLQQWNKKSNEQSIKKDTIADKIGKPIEHKDKKVILQKVITLEEAIEKKDLCEYIYNVKNIDKMISYKGFMDRGDLLQKQFIFLDYRTIPLLDNCYKLFNLKQYNIKKIQHRLIFFKEDSNKTFNLISAIRLKDYKRYLLKKNIWLVPVYKHSYQVIERYNHNLYNIFYKKIFPDYNLNKDFIVLNYKDYKNYKKFRTELNLIINQYIKSRKNFYKKYKIYQDTNPRTWYKNHDREKCWIYALTEIITFNDYLSNVLFSLANKEKFDNNGAKKKINTFIQNIVTNKNYHDKLFNKLSKVYVKDFRKKNWIGTSELDLIRYLNKFLDGFSNNTKTIYIEYKYLSNLTNPYLKDLSLNIDIKIRWRWVKGWHFWLQICNVKQQCQQYWPDIGYTTDWLYREFYWRKRMVEYGINFSMVWYYKNY